MFREKICCLQKKTNWMLTRKKEHPTAWQRGFGSQPAWWHLCDVLAALYKPCILRGLLLIYVTKANVFLPPLYSLLLKEEAFVTRHQWKTLVRSIPEMILPKLHLSHYLLGMAVPLGRPNCTLNYRCLVSASVTFAQQSQSFRLSLPRSRARLGCLQLNCTMFASWFLFFPPINPVLYVSHLISLVLNSVSCPLDLYRFPCHHSYDPGYYQSLCCFNFHNFGY